MNQNKLSFESQNLTVDWIGFKFQNLDNFAQTKLAEYLFNIGFNSYYESGKLAKPIKESILVTTKNQFESWFVGDNYHWKGTLLHFSGSNAARFYFLAKQKVINWTVFFEEVLSRLDLHYARQNKTTDHISCQDFWRICQRNFKQQHKNFSLQKNRKGWILKIGNRRSNKYSRICQGKDFLRFEHEMKGSLLQKYHLLLVDNRLEELEEKLSSYFYPDWLVDKLFYYNYPFYLPNFFQSNLTKNTLEVQVQFFKTFSSIDTEKVFLIEEFFQNYKSTLSKQN